MQWMEQRIRFLPAPAIGRNHHIRHQIKQVSCPKSPGWKITLLNKMFIWKQTSKLLKAGSNKRGALRYGAGEWINFFQENLGDRANSRAAGWEPGHWSRPVARPSPGFPSSLQSALTYGRKNLLKHSTDIPPWMVTQFHKFKHENTASEGKQN